MAESSSTHETARDGAKWEFMEFGVEARGRRAAQNVATEQSGLSRFAFRMVDSPVGAFQVIQYMIVTCSNTFNNVTMLKLKESWAMKNGKFHFAS